MREPSSPLDSKALTRRADDLSHALPDSLSLRLHRALRLAQGARQICEMRESIAFDLNARNVGEYTIDFESFVPMTTVSTRPADVIRNWRVIDASDQVLGRLASSVASVLRGKDKPEYTPHVDVGDYVIIVNAEKIQVTGNKREGKMYHRHSGYPGGLRSMSFRRLQERFPERVVELAVKGMLPRNPLGRQMFRKLKVYSGPDHPHQAQQPQPMEIWHARRR